MQEEKTFGLGMKSFVPRLTLIALAGFRRPLSCAECGSNFRSGEVEFQNSYGARIPVQINLKPLMVLPYPVEFQTSYGARIPV